MATASLPMYDLPEVRNAHDTLWAVLAQNLRNKGLGTVPDHLAHDQPVHTLWNDPDLLISQCCGYDIVQGYKGILRPIATPKFAAFGCLGENYCSSIVVAETCPYNDVRDMAGTIAVINGPESHSGMSALRHLVAQCHHEGRFFSSVKISGSHVASLDMIRAGQANIAAIDSVTLALLSKHQSNTMNGLKILGATYTAPAPPYVVRANLPEQDVKKITDALEETFEEPTIAGPRAQLLLTGLTRARQEDYWILEAYSDHATKHGFPSLQ
jgi:ABC-type phosphate/phosphonate transport system substrate-binding protein